MHDDELFINSIPSPSRGRKEKIENRDLIPEPVEGSQGKTIKYKLK